MTTKPAPPPKPKKFPRHGQYYKTLVDLSKQLFAAVIPNDERKRIKKDEAPPPTIVSVRPLLKMGHRDGQHVWELVQNAETEKYFDFAAMPSDWKRRWPDDCTPIWRLSHTDASKLGDLLYRL